MNYFLYSAVHGIDTVTGVAEAFMWFSAIWFGALCLIWGRSKRTMLNVTIKMVLGIVAMFSYYSWVTLMLTGGFPIWGIIASTAVFAFAWSIWSPSDFINALMRFMFMSGAFIGAAIILVWLINTSAGLPL